MPRIVVVAVDHQPVLWVVRRIDQALGRNVRGRGWTDDGGKANSSQRADCPQHGILPVGRLTNVLSGKPAPPEFGWACRDLATILAATVRPRHRCVRPKLALTVPHLYKPRYLTRGPWLFGRPVAQFPLPRWLELTGPRRLNRRMDHGAT